MRSPFVAFDAHLVEGSGVRAVKGLDFDDLARHVARRARARGWISLAVGRGRGSRFREVSVRLGAEALPGDPRSAAEILVALAQAVGALPVVDVGGLAWDREVARALLELPTRGVWVLIDPASPRAGELTLDREAVSRTVDSLTRDVIDAACAEPQGSLEDRARRALEGLTTTSVGAAARPAAVHLAALVRASARGWPLHKLRHLGVPATVAADACEAGLGVMERDCFVAVGDELDPSLAVEVAEALVAAWPIDAWAHGRAAELALLAGDEPRGTRALLRAVELADDVLARADLWGLAEQLDLEQLGSGARVTLAQAALRLGDVEAAETWARRAARDGASSDAAWVALGLAQLGRGDLVAAHAALSRASRGAPPPSAMAGLAEVAYARGQHDEARRLAAQVPEGEPEAFLAARNTLGKILLARGDYATAEASFAEDVTLAGVLGEPMAELRAHVNRAVAILSAGRAADARPLLEDVLEEGRRRGEPRVVAFALSNLSVIAANERRLADALSLGEQAVTARRRVGEKLGLARVVANLAEIRLMLGLVEEAEHALAFGRAAVSRGTTDARSSHFAIVAARIALARGDTLVARREVELALSVAEASSDGDRASEARRLAARIGLEDGDLAYALEHRDAAALGALPAYARAEVAVLGLSLARAAGDAEVPSLLGPAVDLARRAGDPELLREGLVLRAQIRAAHGDREGAARDAAEARALVEQIAASLPEHLRSRFLARREIGATLALEVAAPEKPSTSLSVTPCRAPRRSSIVGEHRDMRALEAHIVRVARTDATVLVQGESGTGKELVAEALHEASRRADGPLVKVNCGALVESLLLSELFGHEKGAFTGALGKRRGRFELAEGGTLFLDEIGDITPATQVALLRVLQERTFERVGGTTSLRADVRVVCATHRDLRAMVEAGTFRQDLYFRLSQLVLRVPALRDRVSDLPSLSDALLTQIAAERGEPKKALSDDALRALSSHRWPGNVRELDNVLRAVSLFVDGGIIQAADLAAHVEVFRCVAYEIPTTPDHALEPGARLDVAGLVYEELRAGKVGLFDAKRNLERECIARALAESGGNITRAAALLGMKRPRLSQLVKEYGFLLSSEEAS